MKAWEMHIKIWNNMNKPLIAIKRSCWNSAFVKKVFLHVSFTPLATWSWMRPLSGFPLVGTMYWLSVLQIYDASARASSFYKLEIPRLE